MRLPGWETLPMSAKPVPRADGDWYPPSGVPAPVLANILGDSRPEIIAAINDGAIYAVSPDARDPMALRLCQGRGQDLRFRAGGGGPEPRRRARDCVRHVRAFSRMPGVW